MNLRWIEPTKSNSFKLASKGLSDIQEAITEHEDDIKKLQDEIKETNKKKQEDSSCNLF